MSRPPRGIEATESHINFNFVPTPIDLDDAMLDVYEHRVYVHLSRRAQKYGVAWASIKSMAEKCRMSVRRLHTALNTLEARNMIVRHSRDGTTSRITLTDPTQWVSDAASAPHADPPPMHDVQTLPHEPMHEVQTPYARRADKEDKEKKINKDLKKIKEEHSSFAKAEPLALEVVEATPQRESDPDELYVEIWNAHAGPLPKVQVLNESRRKLIERHRKEFRGRAVEIFTAAVKQVATEPFWIERGYGFANLLQAGKVLNWAEKYMHSRGMSNADRKLADTAAQVAAAIGGFDD